MNGDAVLHNVLFGLPRESEDNRKRHMNEVSRIFDAVVPASVPIALCFLCVLLYQMYKRGRISAPFGDAVGVLFSIAIILLLLWIVAVSIAVITPC